MLSALQYMQRTTRSPSLTVNGAPHRRQLGGAPGANGGAAANSAPMLAAPLTRIIFIPTIAAKACRGISGSQIPVPLSHGRALQLTKRASANTRNSPSPPVIKINGAHAEQTKNQRGKLIWFKRAHSRAALRVASSSSRVRRNSSRYCCGIGLLVPQKAQAADELSTIGSGALQETHCSGAIM